MAENKASEKNKVYQGRVVSDKMMNTVVVEYQRTYIDPRLHKTMRSTKKYKVHDAQSEAKVGDLIEFYEGRPVSKTKYMYLARIIQRGNEQ